MFVKICGITRLEDAQAAVTAANALVRVRPESRRFTDPYRARAIVRCCRRRRAVGCFVNRRPAMSQRAPVRLAAAPRDETVPYSADLGRAVIKAVAVGDQAPAVEEWPSHVTLLLDVHDPVKRGGTGRRVDWSAAATTAPTRRVILAGGLQPGNVADAIARVRPFGIDVSSGVERAPGVKDHERIEALFEAVQRAVAGPGGLRSKVRS